MTSDTAGTILTSELLLTLSVDTKGKDCMKMISKFVQIEFADSSIRAEDCLRDIRDATESASLNLYSRYDVQLEVPMLVGDSVILEVRVPTDLASTFAIGNHLRGISAYLIKKCNGRYNDHLVGNRLLVYTEIPSPEVKTEEMSVVDRLEAVRRFAKLLERSDEEAMDSISRILAILNDIGE